MMIRRLLERALEDLRAARSLALQGRADKAWASSTDKDEALAAQLVDQILNLQVTLERYRVTP